MNPVFKFPCIMAVYFVFSINIGDAVKTVDQFLQETVTYLNNDDTWALTLREAKKDFESKKSHDRKDKTLMGEVNNICSEIKMFELSQNQLMKQITTIRTGAVVACNFLNYIKENAPSTEQTQPDGYGPLVNVPCWTVATSLCELMNGNHPNEQMLKTLKEDIKSVITAHVPQPHPHNLLVFFEYCLGAIKNRWDLSMRLVLPCSIVTKYWPIMFPQV